MFNNFCYEALVWKKYRNHKFETAETMWYAHAVRRQKLMESIQTLPQKIRKELVLLLGREIVFSFRKRKISEKEILEDFKKYKSKLRRKK